jgi:IS605 OrfB family transposase
MHTTRKPEWSEKTIPLVLTPGTAKRTYLQAAQAKITAFANQLLPYKQLTQTLTRFHHLVYKKYKYLGIQSQVQEAVQRRVFTAQHPHTFRQLPLEFNFPRSGELTVTSRNNPILKISPLKKRIAFPIRQNGGWQRVREHLNNGWYPHSCLVLKKKRYWGAQLILRKALPPPQEVEGTIGVDSGRKIAAAITVNHPNFPLMEQYLGKDLVWKQHQFLHRRATIQKYRTQGDVRARRAWTRIERKEQQYLTARCAQIAHEIIDLAVLTRSAIVIEDFTHLRKQWTKQASKGQQGAKRTRRQLNKWPYRKLFSFLLHLAQQQAIPVISVNPRYTSQICSRCGKTSKQSRVSRDVYHCIHCGYEVNADRNASRTLSVLGLLELGLSLRSSWQSFLPVPPERRTSCSPVSVVEVRSPTSSGTMNGSVPVD